MVRLSLKIIDKEGEYAAATHGNKDRRYYHIIVENVRRWPIAHNVRVVLNSVEEPGPDGKPQIKWTGEIPLHWQYPELHPLVREIGPPATADLFHISNDNQSTTNELHIAVASIPYDLRNYCNYTGKKTLWLTLRATSTEADSQPVKIKIEWDGKWHAGKAEMAEHVIITEVTFMLEHLR